jgi:hypothetical protein
MAKPERPIEMDDVQRARCDVYIREFEALKTEQVQRISFRDNMLYVTLVAVGGISAFALEGSTNAFVPSLRLSALLVIPWIGAVLGWTYVINDEKISAIGDYIKKPGGARRAHSRARGRRQERALRLGDGSCERRLASFAEAVAARRGFEHVRSVGLRGDLCISPRLRGRAA